METPELKAQPDELEFESTHTTPRRKIDSKPVHTDSLVTIPLSEASQSRPTTISIESEDGDIVESPVGLEDLHNDIRSTTSSDRSYDEKRSTGAASSSLNLEEEMASGLDRRLSVVIDAGRARSDSSASQSSLQVDWEQLDKTEAQEEEEADDDEQTTLLLARLEQENNAIATNPKAIATNPKAAIVRPRLETQSRPPSVYQLKKMVQEQGAGSVRFSLLPTAAPMTELEFWAALVRDYGQTAARLPTITSSKIRGGIPDPLRGVVWVSMAGARNSAVEDEFDRLCSKSSSYENMISKDLGRSFPGVEMFKDPDGEGQRMLGTVLKCFSLYDDKIGYCQGLGFLVGPLLMNMGDKQAFCVLVRLMEDYDLRSCFLPDLSGLHLRMFQFQRLLEQHVPQVSAHLETLGIGGAYLSQWFLSFFAVTCPLPLLFRIYDVIFAEGASETLMRVALAVMQRNERKLLEFTELEDAMRLLLSRQLWDPYGLSATSADELVHDFVGFTPVVTRESLQALEADFRKAQNSDPSAKGFFPDVQSVASRFLGRLWAPSHGHSPSKVNNVLTTNLTAPERPTSTLQRTPSKQSLATLGSTDGGSESSSQSVSTAMTEMSRESTADFASMKSMRSPDSMAGSSRLTMASAKDKDLHNQIEDLLMACTELQREQNLLTAQLEREKDERKEDHAMFRSLVDYLKDNFTEDDDASPIEPHTPVDDDDPIRELLGSVTTLVSRVEVRLAPNNRRSSGYETKSSLRASLAVMREQLANETARNQELAREMHDKDEENGRMKSEVLETRTRIHTGHMERQRLEKTIRELRDVQRTTDLSRASSQTSPDPSQPPSRSDTCSSELSTNNAGLREFRLTSNRSSSQPSPVFQQTFSKRVSSLSTQAVLATPDHTPLDQDALLLELVNAKTAEAVARQELEEIRAKFEAMRKMLNISLPPTPGGTPGQTLNLARTNSRSSDASTPRLGTPTGRAPEGGRTPDGVKGHTAAAPSWGGGGFFGWGKRAASAQVNGS